MKLREVTCPAFLRGCEPAAPWSLKVLLLRDEGAPDDGAWFDRRDGKRLRDGEVCDLAGHRLSSPSPGAFQPIQIRTVHCSADELEEDFAEDLPAEKSSICIQVQSPLWRPVKRQPPGLVLIDLPLRDERLEELAEVARWAGVPIVHRGSARPPWVFSSLHWVPNLLNLWSMTGWVGDDEHLQPLGLAILAARITGWLHYGADERILRQDLAQAFADELPPNRFVWVDDAGQLLGPALGRAVLHENHGTVGTTPSELELMLRRGETSIDGRFPFVAHRI